MIEGSAKKKKKKCEAISRADLTQNQISFNNGLVGSFACIC